MKKSENLYKYLDFTQEINEDVEHEIDSGRNHSWGFLEQSPRRYKRLWRDQKYQKDVSLSQL